MDLTVIMVEPDGDGFCPPLHPRECCRDLISGVWHFCSPDGGRFAVCDESCRHPGPGVRFPRAFLAARGGVTVAPGGPKFTSHGKTEIRDNPWTATAGRWVKFNG